MRKTKNTLGENLPKYFVLGFLGAGALILVQKTFLPGAAMRSGQASQTLAVVEPELSVVAKEGKVLFDKTCATCHGKNAAGTDRGPPFINEIYNPGHHSDEAFYSAARNGVRQHHWPYGNMPPQPDVDRSDVAKIIAYVRELQVANGITYKPHNM